MGGQRSPPATLLHAGADIQISWQAKDSGKGRKESGKRGRGGKAVFFLCGDLSYHNESGWRSECEVMEMVAG